MNKIIMGAIFGLGLGVAACGDGPCDELKDRCSECSDATRSACETAIDNFPNDDACQASLDNSTGCPIGF
jgi:hypothetical protein